MAGIGDFAGTVVTLGDGVLTALDVAGLDPFDLSGKHLRLTLAVDDVSKIGNLNFYVSDGDVLSSSLKWRFDAETASSRIGKSGEAFPVTLQLSEVAAASGAFTLSARGVPSPLAGFVSARLQVSDNGTGPITVRLLRTQVVTPTKPGGYVTVAFDDGYLSTVELGAPRLAMCGLRGTVYPSYDEVNTGNHASVDQLKALAHAGWEIGGHHSVPFTAMTAAAARAALADGKAWLRANFAGSTSPVGLAYPQGGYEDTTDGVSVEMLAADAGYTYGRTILAEVGVATHAQINACPPALPYRLFGMSSVSSVAAAGSPARTAQLIGPGGMLDRVEALGGWLILVFHEIVTGVPVDATQCTEEDLASICQALVDRPALTVLPAVEVFEAVG